VKDSRRLAVVWPLVLGVTALLAVLAAIVAVLVVSVRSIIVPPRFREEDIEILAVDRHAGTITLGSQLDSVVDGNYSLWFSGSRGHARVGKILSQTSESVTRELLSVEFGNLKAARHGRLNGWFYLTPSDVGVAFKDVEVNTELGPAPAWLVPAAQEQQSHVAAGQPRSDKWVIQVHGRAVTRAETIRSIPVFLNAGYTSLLVSYRNDSEAPSSEDGLYALGDSEWRDVEAAVEFAIDHGAQSIVLMGWSMGGAAILQTATRSRFAEIITGVVLDSPVIDWVTVLDFQAKSKGVVRPLKALVYLLLGSRWGRTFTGQRDPINFARLNFVKRASELQVPILILHSDGDDYVTAAASKELAAARPDIVRLISFTKARHTRLWNHNPELWNSSISEWLSALKR